MEKLAVRTAPWRCSKFPAMFALIQHPQHGNILFDTGHSNRFYELTNKFPMCIYRWLIHVEHDKKSDAAYQIKEFGVMPEEINYIIISHFHADHIGSLHDFPNARFIYLQESYDAVKNLNRFSALKAGFLSGLVPDSFVQRSYLLNSKPSISLPEEYSPFKIGYQVFSDDNMVAVDLPGHAHGQIGLFLKITANERVFLIGDACWTSQSYSNLVLPHTISFLAMSGKKEYIKTLKNIHDLNKNAPHVKIIPSHCQQVWNEINKGHL
ncbi:MAG: MBL fold metallo-hydrolase [Gammaproteobacteria bacterium]|nr:MBL fold metallo-hydrolase [Gammaproteobacteria bacterium]